MQPLKEERTFPWVCGSSREDRWRPGILQLAAAGGVGEESAALPWQQQQPQITADTGTNLVMCSTSGWRELRAGGAADKKHASRDESSLGCCSWFCEVDICMYLSTDRAVMYKPTLVLDVDKRWVEKKHPWMLFLCLWFPHKRNIIIILSNNNSNQ